MQKLAVDLPSSSRLGRRMDKDTHDLIIRLCTEAGMRMEDASVIALTIATQGNQDRQVTLDELAAHSDEISALVRAARVLSE